MKLHYDPAYIQNNGEIRVHQEITRELMYLQEEWHIIHSLRISGKYHDGQKAGECDFVLMGKEGIVILEVKGGVIELEENTLYQLKASTGEKRRIKPFDQVEHNAKGLEMFFKERRFPPVFIARVVVFPECSFEYSGISYAILWHLGKKESMSAFIQNELTRQKELFREKATSRLYGALERRPDDEQIKRKIEGVKTSFPRLGTGESETVLKALLPRVTGSGAKSRFIVSRENARSYSEINQAFLSGLHRNPRLMVQGPPGCGKSTYAMELIRRQTDEDLEKGLFLCWNEFLACSIRLRLEEEEDLEVGVDVLPYYGFVQVIINDAGLPPDTLDFGNIGEIATHLKTALEILKSMNRLPAYDFIVVDEAQDLFHRGLEQVLDKCQRVEDGIEKGRYYIFYDNTQAYTHKVDYEQYNFVQDYLHDQSASFFMPVRFRTFGDTGIADFVDDILQGSFNEERKYGDSVEVLESREDKLPEVLPRVKDRLIRETGCAVSDMVLLFSSNLSKSAKPDAGSFVKLSNKNLFSLAEDDLGYTTMLRYKGLEKEVVILVVSDPGNPDLHLMHELYIGASRAISRLVLIKLFYTP